MKHNSVLFYFNLSIIYNRDGQRLRGKVDNRQGALEEMSADAPSVSVWISKRIQIWDGKQKVAVKIQKTLCGGRSTENLIESTCFYLKISRVHVFCSNFSQVCMFCVGDCSKLAPESTQARGFPSWTIVNHLPKNQKWTLNIRIKGRVYGIGIYK